MLNIIVCIKQVPETQEVRLDPVTHTLKREGVKAIINPFDLYALEEGLRVKDAQGGQVTVLTMGPPQAEEALREALGYGADGAVLLSDQKFAGADTWATALTLAKAIEKLGGADLIFTGKQAIDGDTAQVGPMLAAILDIPYAAWARKLTFGDGRGLDGGAAPGPRLRRGGGQTPGPGHRGQGDQRTPGALLQGQTQGQERAYPGVGHGRPGTGRSGRGPERLLHPGGEGLSAAGPGPIRGLDRGAGGTGRPPLAAAQREVQGRGVAHAKTQGRK